MDHQYGVAIANKFALFADDDEDPLEILRQSEEAKNAKKSDVDKKKAKAAKKSAAADSKPKQQDQQLAKKEEKVNQPRFNERGGGRGGRGRELRENDGSRPPRRQGPRENRDNYRGDENVPPEMRDRGDQGGMRRERGEGEFGRGRGRGRGGRGGRGMRGGPRPESGRGGFGGSGGFGPPGERRREFDRHSGNDRTGVKPVDKREGSGAHNWGSYRDDVEEQNQTQNPADESGEWTAPPAEQTENTEANENEETAAPKEEEEAKEMTLDEWRKLEDQKRLKSHFNIRKAGEGVDNTQWKKGVAYTKKKEEEDEEESEEEEEEDDRHGHRKQLVTDIRITFADNPRRGGRGGRGRGGFRGEGRGGRGGGRGGGFGGERPPRGPREVAPRINDETDFPSLVKSEA